MSKTTINKGLFLAYAWTDCAPAGACACAPALAGYWVDWLQGSLLIGYKVNSE